MYDPPYLTKLRSVILPLMTAARIDPLEPQMHRVCRELIAGFKDLGHCDVVADFARKYPIAIFGDLYGLPVEGREEFRQLAETYLHSEYDEQQAAWISIRAIMQAELEARRRSPQEDMLNGIAHGQIDGELIDIDLAVNLASTVFLGGLDTLPSNIGWTLRYLAEHPDHRQRIIDDPSCIPAAVEEFFRVFPAVARNGGVATRDVVFHGVNIRAGDRVVSMLCLANQDGAVFENPTILDFDRQVNKHMAFGAGAHRCLGSHLARHELGVALQEWHAAIPDYRLASLEKKTYAGGMVFGIERLPLEWDVGGSVS
jgi:cytochrome P450